MSYIRGRPTVYKGIRMRSRLEATFAAWLDKQDATWTYEPSCFADSGGQYLPDFAIDADGVREYVEIKPPTADTGAALLKMHFIRASEPAANLYVLVPTGNYPNQGWVIVGRCFPTQLCAYCLGVPFHDLRTVPGADRKLRIA